MTYLRVKRFASDRDVGGKGQYMLAEKMFVKATVGEIPNFFSGGAVSGVDLTETNPHIKSLLCKSEARWKYQLN